MGTISATALSLGNEAVKIQETPWSRIKHQAYLSINLRICGM